MAAEVTPEAVRATRAALTPEATAVAPITAAATAGDGMEAEVTPGAVGATRAALTPEITAVSRITAAATAGDGIAADAPEAVRAARTPRAMEAARTTVARITVARTTVARGVDGGRYHYGWGYYPYSGWGWGWAPYYSSFWWRRLSVYVVTGEGDGYTVDTTRNDVEWNDLDAPTSPTEHVSEENMDVRAEPLPRPPGKLARMRFEITPTDAAVYVDDRYLGAGADLAVNSRGVVTMSGTHTVTVVRPGYKTKTIDITVPIGAPVDVVVELER